MRAVDVIIKKRDKGELTREEIRFFVNGIATGRIPDYQIAAWAMAVLLNGMTPREVTDLTLAIAQSGEVLDMSDVVKIAVDKHSTGGVGDKTSLVVLPAVAACGLPVGKMSGRGLGFSGGTLDKLESIPGYRVDLTTEEFETAVKGDRPGPVRAVEGPGARGWKTVCPAGCDWHRAVHPVDRLLGDEQEDRRRRARRGAGCEGGQWRVHGESQGSPRAG